MTIRFDEQVVVVTGAGSGLGRAYALALARRGARVVVNDHGVSVRGVGEDASVAQGVVDEIRAAGGQAVADTRSVSAPDAGLIVQTALDAFGRVDALVCNAGTGRNAPFAELSMEDFRAVVEVNLFGSVAVAHAAWPHMAAQGYGRIVLTSSAAGMWGVHNVSPYCAAKAGIIGLAKGLALEAEPLGLKVNVIAPAAKTRMSEHLFEGRRGWTWRPEIVEPLVTYLASTQCRHNGAVFAGLGGNFAKVETLQAVGKTFDARGDVTPEDILAYLPEIEDMAGARSVAHGRDIGAVATGAPGDPAAARRL